MRLTSVTVAPSYQQLGLRVAGAVTTRESLLLAPVLVLGLLFRLWDIAQPFIGYHMWNEVYYTTIARNFEHFGLLTPCNYSWLGGASLGPRYASSPFVPWLIFLASRLLGNAEWVARIPMLLLGLFSLVMVHLIARELYNTRIALAAAFAAAVMPGVVFFSRQVALDGPMTAFGLAAVWCLLLARRTQRLRWLLASSVLLGIAVFAKYTAVLFVPCIAWIWLTMLRGDWGREKRLRWFWAGIYVLVSALPAVAWLSLSLHFAPALSTAGRQSAYLNRSFEWDLSGWKMALLDTWNRLGEQAGRIFWYPLALGAILAVAARKVTAFARANIVVTLLIVPWFAQLIYPYSWTANDAYTYPVLYGIAILLAVAMREVQRHVSRLAGVSASHVRASASLLIILIASSCLLDYRQTYHWWYTSDASALQRLANVVTMDTDPFASARLVHAVNVSHQPVLADTPATLYYAEDEYWKGTGTWWWWGLGEVEPMIAAITGRIYAYVVFTYDPPVSITAALARSGYRSIGPAVWEKIADQK